MFAELLEQKLYHTLPIGQVIAAWFMRGEDLIWLHKEYQKMFDLFKDSPAIQWLEESFTAEALKRAEQQSQQELQNRLREAEKHAQQQLRNEQKKTAVALHKVVIELFSQHFPTLKGLAKAQVRTLEKPEQVQALLLHLLQVHDTNEAQEILLRLNTEEEETN